MVPEGRRESQLYQPHFGTHDLGVVAEIADDVAVMHNGEILERGTVQDILHHPHTVKYSTVEPLPLNVKPRPEEPDVCEKSIVPLLVPFRFTPDGT